MPNGETRNWVRFCAAIDGFRQRFERWPTKVAVDPVIYEDLQWMFSEKAFRELNSRVRLDVRQGAMIAAEDGEGHVYDYGEEGFPSERPQPSAGDWLGVHPEE